MDAAETLGRILSIACPADVPDADGWRCLRVSLHCAEVDIVARPIRRVANDDGDYVYSEFETRSVTQRND